MSNGFRKVKKNLHRKNSDKYVEFMENIGPLPAGCYQLLEKTETGFMCEFESVVFGVHFGGEESYRYLIDYDKEKLTTRDQFLEKYWGNLDKRKQNPLSKIINFNEPLTFCSMDPKLEKAPNKEYLN